jgi:hypothetical protein
VVAQLAAASFEIGEHAVLVGVQHEDVDDAAMRRHPHFR